MLGHPFKTTLPFILISMVLYLILLPMIQFPSTTFFKAIPIALLMLFTLQVNCKRPVKVLLLFALGFSLIGDILLTFPVKMALQMGILAFMATHCCYISLFLKNMQFRKQNVLSFLPVLAFVLISFYFLSPFLGEMKTPVAVYLCLLTLMVFFAFQVKKPAFLTRLGACLFLLSDFVLSINLFVLLNNKPMAVLVMFLYYLAQFLLVISITQTKTMVFFKIHNLFHGHK